MNNAGTCLPAEVQHGTLGEVWHGEADIILRGWRLIRYIALVILCGPVLARLNA